MQQYFLPEGDIGPDGVATVRDAEFRHMVRVLRMRPGDEVRIAAGGRRYAARLAEVRAGEAVLTVLGELEARTEPRCDLTLLQGLPKGDKAERVIRQGAELGAARLWVFGAERSVPVLPADRAARRTARWTAIAKESSEVAQRGRIPEVRYFPTLAEALEALGALGGGGRLIVPYENQARLLPGLRSALQELRGPQKGESGGVLERPRISFVIGPEGGFSPAEIGMLLSSGARLVTLGPRILRTETAGMAVLAMALYEFDEMGGA